MKLIIFLSVVYVVTGLAPSFLYEQEWQEFKKIHKVNYRTPRYEIDRRRIFEENLHKINQHNILYEQGLKSHKLGITPFADLTTEEFRELLNLKTGRPLNWLGRSLFQLPTNESEIPDSIDWREKGAVTGVKSQGQCGSCWAFATIGSIEAQYFLKHGELVSFSEQQLVDCTGQEYGAGGCNGALLPSGLRYIKDYGIETESDYPYTMTDTDTCRADSSLFVTRIRDFVSVPSNDEEALRAATGLIGPVIVGIDAGAFDMQFYRGGIYTSESCSRTALNHAVLVVGYGSENGVDYWIVKNSWGAGFGLGGYIYMMRGVNQCGIAVETYYPVM